jgi:hypothetical protein
MKRILAPKAIRVIKPLESKTILDGMEYVWDRQSYPKAKAKASDSYELNASEVPAYIVRRDLRKKTITDPFLVFRETTMLAAVNGELPKVTINYNGTCLITDKISPKFFQYTKNEPLTKAVLFTHLPTMGHVFDFIRLGTHLVGYYYLTKTNVEGLDSKQLQKEKRKRLNRRKKLSCMLQGKPYTGSPDSLWRTRKPLRKYLAYFVNGIKTVDGILISLLLSCPEAKWTWEYIQNIFYHNFGCIIDDMFIADDATDEEISKSFYVNLKKFRKALKYESNFDPIIETVIQGNGIQQIFTRYHIMELDPRLEWIRPLLAQISKGGKTPFYTQTINTLTQSRGVSVPFGFVARQAARKFKTVVTEEPVKIDKNHAMALARSVSRIFDLGDMKRFKTSLKRGAKINISTSACVEELKKDAGKMEYLRKVLSDHIDKKTEIPVRDLDTGKITSTFIMTGESTDPSIGTFSFYWALNFCINNPERVRQVVFSAVSEPGKARGITKGTLACALVLFPIAELANGYLKTIPSSSDGMSKGHPGWKFFTRLSVDNPEADFMFRTKDRSVDEKTPEHLENWNIEKAKRSVSQLKGFYPVFVHEKEQTVFAFFTDYVTATDYADWVKAKILLSVFLTRLGLGKFIIKFAVELLCSYRNILIKHIADNGEEIIDQFYSKRGVLMGDPLTKCFLHLVNLVARDMTYRTTKWMQCTISHRRLKY